MVCKQINNLGDHSWNIQLVLCDLLRPALLSFVFDIFSIDDEPQLLVDLICIDSRILGR
jgi:hypothetical protein